MKTVERQGAVNSQVSRRYPTIHGGQCERHGTVDPLQPATVQYLLCGCFNDVGEIRCSYCPDNKNPQEVIRISDMNVAVHPDDNYKPADAQRVVAWCNSFECSDKHLKRFKVNGI